MACSLDRTELYNFYLMIFLCRTTFEDFENLFYSPKVSCENIITIVRNLIVVFKSKALKKWLGLGKVIRVQSHE